MKIIIFGATGTIGQALVKQSLEAGHEVTAFCRDNTKLTISSHPNLYHINSDVLNEGSVEHAVKGQDAVCIVLGSGKNRKSTIRSQGTQVILKAMKTNGIKRLICQSTLGTGDSKQNLNFFWKHIMFGWFLKKIFIDHVRQENFVRNSSIDWTIVRPSAFTDGPITEKYIHGFGPHQKGLSLKIARNDVAHFILKELSTNEYIQQAVSISN